jgi:hypothetical protein
MDLSFTLSQLGGLVDRGGPGTLRTGIPGDSLGGVPKTEDVQDLTVHPVNVPTSGR